LFVEWRSLVGEFFSQPPHVEHFSDALSFWISVFLILIPIFFRPDCPGLIWLRSSGCLGR
jgi:hypothetical protein